MKDEYLTMPKAQELSGISRHILLKLRAAGSIRGSTFPAKSQKRLARVKISIVSLYKFMRENNINCEAIVRAYPKIRNS